MTFKGDTDQTRVKNSSFGMLKFYVLARAIPLIFLFERVCQDAGNDVVFFF
jgi:hypothetical protein